MTVNDESIYKLQMLPACNVSGVQADFKALHLRFTTTHLYAINFNEEVLKRR